MTTRIPALDKHIDYWNQWHADWFNQHLYSYRQQTILQWPVPAVKGGRNISLTALDSYEFFPEPYWGNIYQPASAVFINWNPGEGGHMQHIQTYHELKNSPGNLLHECQVLWAEYEMQQRNYADTVSHLSRRSGYPTTEWMHNERSAWAKNLMKALDLTSEENCEADNSIMFEFCPWHTQVASTIEKYLKNNRQLIGKYVLDFAVEKASMHSCGPLRKLIFSKGTVLNDKILAISEASNSGTAECINNIFAIMDECQVSEKGILISPKTTGKGGWLINIYQIGDVFLINCHGANGGGNGFPKPAGVFLDIIHKVISMRV